MRYRTCIIDAPFLTRRAYEAGGVNAMVGATLTKLLQIHREYEVGQTVFAWEPRGCDRGAFRQGISEDYKSRRRPPPAEYLGAMADLQARLPMMGVTQAYSEAEADDVAHTIATTWPGPHLLWSADKDWLQNVGPVVHMLRPQRGSEDQLVTPENIVELTGLSADGWTEVLCLAGDTVDDIPGLPRVGAKRARDLHAACPDMVRLLLAGQLDEVRQAAAAAGQMQWAERAILNIKTLRLTYDLVRPYRVELDIVDPIPASAEDLLDWLRPHDLEAMVEDLMMLTIPSEDPFATDGDVDLEDLPF